MRSLLPNKKKDAPTVSKMKKKLWKVFSVFIKQRDKGICYTCGAFCEGKNAHCGHFIPKSVGGLALYFHEDNNHLQCARCNIWLSGNQYIYGQKLGKKKVKELYKIKEKITKDYPFIEKIQEYERRNKQRSVSIG